jgi:cytoplasmic polyadenylation element-binding protein
MLSPSQQIDAKKTVFVGALHGTINAEGLCNIFNELFGGVIFASRLIQRPISSLCNH